MSIDSSGNVTGTGNTLADAVGVVAGVTSQVIGGLTIYSLDLAGNPYFKIQSGGFLTIDPRVERTIVISYPTLSSTTGLITILDGGTLTGGFDVSAAGTDKFTQGEIITSGVSVGSGSTACCGDWHLIYGAAGSQLNLLGVTIATSTYWKSVGNVTLRDFKNLGIASTAQIRLGGGSVDIDGFEVHGFSLVLNANLSGSDVFNGFKPVLSALNLSVESTNINAPQTDKPVGVFGNIDNSFNSFRSPVTLWQKTAGYVLHNMKQGGLTRPTPQNTSASQYGFIEQYKDFELTVKDGSGNLLSGATVYVPQYAFSETISSSDNTFHGRSWAESSYSATTASGIANINSFLYKIQHTQPSATTRYVYADKVGSGVGTLDFRIKSYGKLITVVADVLCDDINRKSVSSTTFNDVTITESNAVTVGNYPASVSLTGTALTVTGDGAALQSLTSYQLYDILDLYLSDNYAGETETIITRAGVEIGGRALDINFSYIDFTGDMITTGVISLLDGSIFNGTRTDANGTIYPPRQINVTNIVAGSRLRIYNNTTASQTYNDIVAGTTYSAQYVEGVGYSAGDSLSIRLTADSKLIFSATVIVEATGWSAFISQEPNSTYISYGKDGSTISGIAWDSGNMQFDFNDADNNIDGADIGAWYYYFITTGTGISEAFGAISWPQINRLRNITSLQPITFDNTKDVPLQINNCWVDRDDGVSIIAATSNSIQINPPAVFVAETSTSGLTPDESAKLTAIKVSTDEIHEFSGLTLGKPVTFTQTGISTSTKSATITGDRMTTSTVTRNA